MPFGLRLHYEMNAERARLAEKGDDAELRKTTVALIDIEIERLTELEKILETIDRERREFKLSAAVIPGPEVSDRLLRCETQLSPEIARIRRFVSRLGPGIEQRCEEFVL